jgi:hypothetical protein
MEVAKAEKVATIDEKYIAPKLEALQDRFLEEDSDDELGGDDRLS